MKKTDKFCILVNDENREEIKRLADENGYKWTDSDNKFPFDMANKYYFFRPDGITWSSSHTAQSPPLITLSQFRALFDKEIIGYKCPMDLWNGRAKLGEVFIPVQGNSLYYYPSSMQKDWACIPAEIVETWEPVFKEEKKIVVVGGKEWEVSKDSIKDLGNPKQVIYTIEYLLDVFNEKSTLSEIKNLIDAYKQLNKE